VRARPRPVRRLHDDALRIGQALLKGDQSITHSADAAHISRPRSAMFRNISNMPEIPRYLPGMVSVGGYNTANASGGRFAYANLLNWGTQAQ
jgi:hypothetical protein